MGKPTAPLVCEASVNPGMKLPGIQKRTNEQKNKQKQSNHKVRIQAKSADLGEWRKGTANSISRKPVHLSLVWFPYRLVNRSAGARSKATSHFKHRHGQRQWSTLDMRQVRGAICDRKWAAFARLPVYGFPLVVNCTPASLGAADVKNRRQIRIPLAERTNTIQDWIDMRNEPLLDHPVLRCICSILQQMKDKLSWDFQNPFSNEKIIDLTVDPAHLARQPRFLGCWATIAASNFALSHKSVEDEQSQIVFILRPKSRSGSSADLKQCVPWLCARCTNFLLLRVHHLPNRFQVLNAGVNRRTFHVEQLKFWSPRRESRLWRRIQLRKRARHQMQRAQTVIRSSLLPPSWKSTFSQPFNLQHISNVVRIGSIIILYRRKLWKAKFFILWCCTGNLSHFWSGRLWNSAIRTESSIYPRTLI